MCALVTGVQTYALPISDHRAHGVDLRTGAMVEALEKTNGRVSAVLLTGGERIAADMVIVGIGIIPETAPLPAAGASGGNGVEENGRASCRERVCQYV